MSAPTVWVVGASGLLGASVVRALGGTSWRPDQPIAWGDDGRLERDFREDLAAFATRTLSDRAGAWAICYCAGAGVVGTSAAALTAETNALRLFLDLLSAESRLMALPGYMVLASSAGGVYGGSRVCPITEATDPEPISDYGRAKLEQERMLCSWASRRSPSVGILVARLANLYGAGQRLDKPQGLISHLSRCLIFNAPVHVYVSLDTIRDYLFAEDAGRQLVAGLRRLMGESSGEQITKIYASEREISIAGLLGIFRRISRRRLRVICGLHPGSALQPRRLQFRSHVWRTQDDAGAEGRQIELVEGINQVYRAQLALFRRGVLPPPLPPRAVAFGSPSNRANR
jgi:UDP-glucose 4-epimerase